MSTAQPPSDADRPGPEPEGTTEAATPIAGKPGAKRTPARRTSATAAADRAAAAGGVAEATEEQGAGSAPKKTPSSRKRPAAKASFSPVGEAPEIMDATLRTTPAADTSGSPVEPLATETEEPASTASAEAPRVAGTAEEQERLADERETEEPVPPRVAGHPGLSVNDLADRLDDSRFFSTLFDFTFTSYVTRKLAGPVYVVGLVLVGLGILVGFTNSLGVAIATNSPGGAFVFLLGVLVTLVAAVLAVLLLRVTIEVFCAIIEIAQNTRPRRRPPRR